MGGLLTTTAQTFTGDNLGSGITNGSPIDSQADATISGTIGVDFFIENVSIDITHTFTDDLEITLISPSGTSLILTDDNGGTGEDFTNTVFQDGGADITAASAPFTGTFEPEGGTFASTFDGENVNGLWTLNIVDDAGGDDGTLNNFEITIEAFPPANDNICDAETLLVSQGNPSATDYTNDGATAETDEPVATCFNGGINGSVWFNFTAPLNGEVTVSTDFTGGSLTDTEIAVYEAPGDCNDLTTLTNEVGCDQDSGVDEGFNSILNLTGLTPGDTYFVQVDRWGSTVDGTFGIAVTTPPPSNDDICNATDLVFGATSNPDDYTNVGSTAETNEPVPGCFDGGINSSVWFTFDAPANADTRDVRVSTDIVGSTLDDTEIAVYEAPGDCNDLTTLTNELGCNQDGGTDVIFNSVVELSGLTPNDTYYIQVDRWGSTDDGTFGIEVDYTPPANDDICNAESLTFGADANSDDYDNFSATAETDEPVPGCFDSGINGSVWFTFVAPANADTQDVRVSTDIAGSTLDDTEIAVYEAPGDCNDLTTLTNELGCNQDGGVDINFNSILDLTGLTPGDTYYVQVDRWGSANDGTFGIEIDYTPPANDDACDAINLTIDDTPAPDQYDIFGASSQPNEPVAVCFNSGINGSVWFTFTAPSNGEATVTTDFTGGSLIDTEIAVYEAPGDCNDLTTLTNEVDCNQDGGVDVDFNSIINLTGLTAGDTYYIQVDRWGSADDGTFGIEVQSTLSTDNFDKTDFTYYPNPVKDILNVDIDQVVSQYSIYNMTGKKVLNGSPESIDPQINTSSLQTGTYLVKISVNGKSESFTIIKK